MKNILSIFVIVMTMGSSAIAGTQAGVNGAEFDLNLASPNMLQKHQLGTKVLKETVHTAAALFDVAYQLKISSASVASVGTYSLRDPSTLLPLSLPKGAIIRNCVISSETAFTGVGASVALQVASANDIKAATAIATYTGLVACVPVGTAATSFKLSADALPKAVISGAGLTAGKIRVYIDYVAL